MGARHHSAALLRRRRPDLRRHRTADLLLDRRRYRADRCDLGRRMVRGRGRPQLGLQPGLQDGEALNGQLALLISRLWGGRLAALRTSREGPEAENPKFPGFSRKPGSESVWDPLPADHILFLFVLVLFLDIG